MSNWLKTKKAILAWAPSSIWALVILISSLFPTSEVPTVTWPYADKVMHFGIYAVLAVLMLRGFALYNINHMQGYIFTLILGMGYGILMELVQLFVPGRQADVFDIMANTMGLACGIILRRLILWLR